ncbi:hypothetical protein Glove_283g101 [Diversispora epigaea]|uniref:SLC26A/SulP transporter domain-containing protein n=1 Tax=Diversispora epigaea TaxID=1348612 RepID=A0A397I3H7_9GLOM|nr:hypothetical protein Glove_283g101 [Diversispora epigaea]
MGLAYAKLATLPPEYGLYSSFVGVSIYCFFSTAKDVTNGPTVVLSLLIGQAIAGINKQTLDYTGPQIAASFALFSGLIALFLGLFRLGFLIEDAIPAPVVEGFTTGSAITISMAQFSKLFGISGVDTKKPTYYVFGKTLIGLPHTEIDVVFGILGLIYLYTIKFGSSTISLVIICTLIAYLINIGKKESPIKILKHVPSGLRQIRPAKFDTEILRLMSGYLPGILIILILEHISIAKNFGRINSYTAIKAKSGVFFYYIPDATLAAVIIHAVLGLVTPLSYLKSCCEHKVRIFFYLM